MIAQVFTLPAPPGGEAPEALGPVAQAAMKETRDADGCEGLYPYLPAETGVGGSPSSCGAMRLR